MVTTTGQISTPGFQSLRSRYAILASFYLAIVLAIPVWIKTTTIERLPLPRQQVIAWESTLPCPLRTHQSLTLHFPPGVIKPTEEHVVAEEVRRGLKAAGDGAVEQRVRGQEGSGDESKEEEGDKRDSLGDILDEVKALAHAACIDWDVRVKSSAERRVVAGLHYEVDFLGEDVRLATASSTTTTRRFQLPLPSLLRPNHDFGSQEVSSILASYLARVFQLPYTNVYFPSVSSLPMLQASQEGEGGTARAIEDAEERMQDRRRIPYTRNVRMVFSLINEDISAPAAGHEGSKKGITGVRGWDGRAVENMFGARFERLLRALSGTQTFYREMQSTWFAPLQFDPKLLEVEVVSRGDQGIVSEGLEATGQASGEPSMSHLDEGDAAEEGEVDALEELSSEAKETPIVPAAPEVEEIHLIDWEDIKVFVNSGEWSLTSGAITSPLSSINASAGVGASQDMSELFEQTERTLHFVLYIPKPSHRPLRVAGDADATEVSAAKGWLIPQWGGVALFNLGYEGDDAVAADRNSMLDSLSAAEMDDAFAMFEKQFDTLLGLQALEIPNVGADLSLALRLDALARRRIVAASRESVKTLGSIVRLVDKIENLGVGQSVQDDVSKALVLLQEATQLMNTTSFDSHTPLPETMTLTPLQTLLHLVHASELLSSRAFFNPNMLGQLYFPDEHKYAVYTPLFGPLAVPLLVAGIRLLKERRKNQALLRQQELDRAASKAK